MPAAGRSRSGAACRGTDPQAPRRLQDAFETEVRPGPARLSKRPGGGGRSGAAAAACRANPEPALLGTTCGAVRADTDETRAGGSGPAAGRGPRQSSGDSSLAGSTCRGSVAGGAEEGVKTRSRGHAPRCARPVALALPMPRRRRRRRRLSAGACARLGSATHCRETGRSRAGPGSIRPAARSRRPRWSLCRHTRPPAAGGSGQGVRCARDGVVGRRIMFIVSN